MPDPTHLPSFLTEDAPIPDDDLAHVGDAIGASPAPVDAALWVIEGDDPTEDGPAVPEIALGYRIGSTGEAEWAMRKLREARSCLAEVKAQADQWRAEIDAWQQRAGRRHAGTAAYMECLLIGYGGAARRANPKVATIELPTGVIETTTRRPRPVVTDPDALVAWALENAPQAVKVETTRTVPYAAAVELGSVVEDTVEQVNGEGTVAMEHTVRSFVTSAGTPVPGMDVEPPRVDVRVKPAP